MPLSEGATRARHARRLLQRVLDFAPGGDDDPPDRPDRPARRRGNHRGVGRAGGRPDHLRLGRQGAGRPRRDRPVGLLADDRRGRPRLAGRHRRRQAARLEGHPADHRPGPRRSPRRARCPLRRRDRPAPRRQGQRPPLRPAGDHPGGPRPGGARPRQFLRQHIRGKAEGIVREAANVRNAILREAEKADLVVMGASAQPAGADGAPTCSAPCRRRSPPVPARRVVVVKTRETIGRQTFEQLASRQRPSPPPIGRPRRHGRSPPGSSAGSASRTSTTRSSPTFDGWSSSRRSRA